MDLAEHLYLKAGQRLSAELTKVSQERKRLRHYLIREIRKGIGCLSASGFKSMVERKARLNYMGDFSDHALIHIFNLISKAKGA